MSKKILAIPFFILISTLIFGKINLNKNNNPLIKPIKYVAFAADTEAYFTPGDFVQFQGEYTQDIVNVCENYDIPFTWLIIVDNEHTEVRAMAEKHYPTRKNIDEFSLHTHFKWFIMDEPDDFESFKIIDRRMEWLNEAKEEIIKAGLPMPLTFRYGGGDSNDEYYCIEDLVFLIDDLGIRNFLFSAERLQNVIGIKYAKHENNNVWKIDGGRQVTLLSTCVYLDSEENMVIKSIDERLDSSDYAIVGCHDYRKIVPENLKKAIVHLNENYNVKYVTVDQVGELVRKGKINNLN
jgi:hypothetical protein